MTDWRVKSVPLTVWKCWVLVLSVLLIQASAVTFGEESANPDTQSRIQAFEKQFSVNLLAGKNEALPLTERAVALQKAIASLNEIKRINLLKDLSFFQGQIEGIKISLASLSPKTDVMLQSSELNADQLDSLHEFAQAQFLYGFLLSPWHNLTEKKSAFVPCTSIYETIASKTTQDLSKEKQTLLEMGAQSRLWLAIMPLIVSDLDQVQTRLDTMKPYMDFVKKQSISSDQIDHAYWTMREIECELAYAQEDYDKCVTLADRYFGEIWPSLTPASPVTHASLNALEGLYYQIKSLLHVQGFALNLHDLDKFMKDVQKENRREALDKAVKKLREQHKVPDQLTQEQTEARDTIIKKAEFLASFDDRQTLKLVPTDNWKLRILQLGHCYSTYHMVDKMIALESKYYHLDPVRFEDFTFSARLADLKQRQKELLEKRKKKTWLNRFLELLFG